MELHESLHALGQSQGRALFDDPDGFRGALDDYLDEDAATTGDINLLVDAVRLGAFASMQTMLDSGATPDRAVQEAGARLARDRGSSDLGGAQWALAVLGYAVGTVGDAQVRAYRSAHLGGATGQVPGTPAGGATSAPPPPPAEPTAFRQPPVSPAQPLPPTGQVGQPPAQGGWSAPGSGYSAPAAGYSAPAAPSGAPGQTGWSNPAGGYSAPVGPGSGWQSAPAPPTKKSRTVPILVAVGVVLVILVAGGIGFVVTRGDDNGGGGGGGGGEEELSLAAADIDERYAALAESVTLGLPDDGCETADAASGESEHLTCTFDGGTLDLVTYESEDDATSARGETLNYDDGSMSQIYDDGTAFYSYDPSNVDSGAGPAQVYWDVPGETVSAAYVGDDSAEVDSLVSKFEGTTPTVEQPTTLTDAELSDFSDDFIDVSTCERIWNLADGETEENRCSAEGVNGEAITVYSATFETASAFRTYRANRKTLWEADGASENDFWQFTESGAREGSWYLYNNGGQAVLYWDQPDCQCYLEAYLASGDTTALNDWWVQA